MGSDYKYYKLPLLKRIKAETEQKVETLTGAVINYACEIKDLKIKLSELDNIIKDKEAKRK